MPTPRQKNWLGSYSLNDKGDVKRIHIRFTFRVASMNGGKYGKITGVG
jgi:hypothetical protein